MHSSAVNVQCRSRFVFRLCFWKCGFSEVKCTFLVKLGIVILDQVCRVHEILPLWSRTCQWTVKNNFLYEKINLDLFLWILWQHAVRLLLNKIQCKTLKPRFLFAAIPVEWKGKLISTEFGLDFFWWIGFLSIFSAVLVLSFWCVFWSCGSSVFQCSFLVSLRRAILDQVRYVPEVISEPCNTLLLIVKWT